MKLVQFDLPIGQPVDRLAARGTRRCAMVKAGECLCEEAVGLNSAYSVTFDMTP